MHIWDANAGNLQVQAGPLRPHVFEASLRLRDAGGFTLLPGNVQPDGTYLFDVTAQQVTAILAHQAFLFLTTRHAVHIGSPDLRWGWRYRLIQGANPLTATDGTGTALVLDPNGYFSTALENFDETVEIGRETIILK